MASHRWIFAGRVLLLGIAAGAVAAGFVAGRTDASAEVAVTYVCPMHPEVTSPSPSTCPICSMALEPKKPASDPMTEGSATNEPALALAQGAELRSFHDVTRARPYITSREMRVPASLESASVGSALFHLDEVELLAPHEEGFFYAGGAGPSTKVRLTGEPPVKWDSATALVRFRVDPKAGLSPNQAGWLKVGGRLRRGLVVPYATILQSPQGPYVLTVADDRRTVIKRPVEIGSVLYGYAAIVSGLEDGERVAAMNTFFLDAERRAKAQHP